MKCVVFLLLAVCATQVLQVESYARQYCPRRESYVEKYKFKECYAYYRPWGWWSRTRCCYRWVTRYRTKYRINSRACCPGWGSCYCHIPICSPSCGSHGICLAPAACNTAKCSGPNFCYCKGQVVNPTSSRGCSSTLCTYQKDCFPGYCGGSTCKCASGFESDRTGDCRVVTDGPIFDSCSVKLIPKGPSEGKPEFNQICGDENSFNFTFYSSIRDYNIDMNWNTRYAFSPDNFTLPAHMVLFAPGIAEAYANITLKNAQGGNEVNLDRAWESNSVNASSPRVTLSIKNAIYNMGKAMGHNYRLDVLLYSKTGCYKKNHDRSRNQFAEATFDGTSLARQVRVIFDLVPPTHCSKDNSCDPNDVGYPLYIEPDVSNSTVQFLWSSWNDSDSGIGEFSYEIFSMAPDQNDELSEQSPALFSGTWPIDSQTIPSYKPDTAGTYSVILTVTDQAGNENKARSLFLYDPDSQVILDSDSPITVEGAAEASTEAAAEAATEAKRRFWVHSFRNQSGGAHFKINWKDHFVNRVHTDKQILGKVKAFPYDFDDKDGNRTTAAITHERGILKFETGFTKNPDFLSTEPDNWINQQLKTEAQLNVIHKDGDVICLWVRATDILQRTKTDYVVLRVDASSPVVNPDESRVVRNIQTKHPLPVFATAVEVNAVDEQSGITNMDYILYDVSLRSEYSEVLRGSIKPSALTMEDALDSKCQHTGNCYCLSTKVCYMRMLPIYFSNCIFMERDYKEYKLDVNITNGASLNNHLTHTFKQLDGLKGEGEYPPIPNSTFRVADGKLRENSVTLEWRHPLSCYDIVATLISYDIGSKTKEERFTGEEARIEGLCGGTEYEVNAVLEYEGGARSEAQKLIFTTQEGDTPCYSGGLGAGAIVGIVIVVIILLLLLVIIIILLVRRQQHKPMIPAPVSERLRPVTNRFSAWFPGNSHVDSGPPPYDAEGPPIIATKTGTLAYANNAYGEDDDDVYIYGNMNTGEARWKFSEDRFHIGKPLQGAKGRFADIKLAIITTKSGSRQVVAKMLKPTSGKDDELLMKAKMNFMGTKLSFHPNIVNFIGALPDDPSGPVLILEYCDKGRLSDWLKNTKFNEEMEVNMSNFAIMIACGMEFLHRTDIFHRRLGARNVLLLEKSGTLHAKVTGFGPMKGEADGAKGDSDEKIPIKWMAPEQFTREPGQKRVYTKQTDVWSYGITLWEIFSKGKGPYKGTDIQTMKKQVTNGYRMDKPDYCDDYIYENIMQPSWDEEPLGRPTMDTLWQELKKYYENAGVQSGYYGDDDSFVDDMDDFYFDAESAKKKAREYDNSY